MQIRSVKFVNFCQYTDFQASFPPGIIGILGGNGRGKSNLIKGIRFGIVGESGNPGAKIEDLTWQAAEANEAGSVEVEFDIFGQLGTIKRFINTSRTSLKFGEGKAITKANLASNRMIEISGSNKKVLEDIIFVLQGKLESILFEQSAERTKKLQGLFGIANVEQLRQVLNQEAALITTEPTDNRIAELQAQLDDEIDTQLRELNDSRDVLLKVTELDADSLQARVDAWKQYETKCNRYQELTLKRNKLTVELNAVADVTTLEAHGAALAEKQAALGAQVDSAKHALATVNSAKTTVRAREHLQAEIQQCNTVLATAAPEVPPFTWDAVHSGQQQVAVAREELARTQRYLQLHAEGKTGPCELCGQLLQFTPERVAEAQQLVASQPAIIEQTESIINTIERTLTTYDTDNARYLDRKADAEKRLAAATNALAQSEDVEIPNVDEAALQEFIKQYDLLSIELSNTNQQLATAREQTARIQGALSGIAEELDALEFEEPCTEDQYREATATLSHIETCKLEQARIDGALKQLHVARVRVLAELEGLKQQAGLLESKRKYRQLCLDARDVLHRDVLPKQVMRQYLSALNAELAKYLQLFNVPFSCTITDDLDIVCRINGYSNKPAARLSGGLRVMLGIAFRFAIYNMFAAKLGFMVLDEPTVWLDGDHISTVVDMMITVRDHVIRSGLQLFIVTHQKALMPVFDHIIEL